jgi:hypothetical protein
MAKQQKLELKRGETVTFPVSGHQLTRFQTLEPVKSLEQVRHFSFVKGWQELQAAKGNIKQVVRTRVVQSFGNQVQRDSDLVKLLAERGDLLTVNSYIWDSLSLPTM